jgi:hypothetical protein
LNPNIITQNLLDASIAIIAKNESSVLFIFCLWTFASLLFSLYAVFQARQLREEVAKQNWAIERLQSAEQKRIFERLSRGPDENVDHL